METKKEMTIEDLAKLMTAGFEKSAKQTDKKIESLAKQTDEKIGDLARIIANRFDEMDKKMDDGFKKVNADIGELQATTDRIERTLIQKVDKIEYNTLDYRVEKLEEKFA